MIQAFDKIQAAGDMQPSLVAGGIKVALSNYCFRTYCCNYSSNIL
jgi:biopolymer transport protein ExbB